MRSRYFRIILSCLLMGLLAPFGLLSCSGTEEVTFQPPPFTVDSKLLAEPFDFPELGLRMYLPRGWIAVDSTARDSFRRMQAGTALSREFYPIYSLGVFTDSASGSIAFIARVEQAEGELTEINKGYASFLRSRIDETMLRSDYYRINNLEICYYFHHTEQIVDHKLFGKAPTGGFFLIEYVVPMFANPGLEAAVTSAIAALSPLDGDTAGSSAGN